jgi:hypothetical protein
MKDRQCLIGIHMMLLQGGVPKDHELMTKLRSIINATHSEQDTPDTNPLIKLFGDTETQ